MVLCLFFSVLFRNCPQRVLGTGRVLEGWVNEVWIVLLRAQTKQIWKQ
jgi:hypothetical protein